MPRKPYPSDVSDEEWALVAPYLVLLPTRLRGGPATRGALQRPVVGLARHADRAEAEAQASREPPAEPGLANPGRPNEQKRAQPDGGCAHGGEQGELVAHARERRPEGGEFELERVYALPPIGRKRGQRKGLGQALEVPETRPVGGGQPAD